MGLSDKIKGITIEIGGDTSELSKSLKNINTESRNIQSDLREVNKLLKLDPTNTQLLQQKHDLLAKSVENSSTRLDALKAAQTQVDEAFAKGDLPREEYDAFQREIMKAEQALKKNKTAQEQFNSESNKTASATEKLTATVNSQEKELSELKKQYIDIALEKGKDSEEAEDLKQAYEKLNTELGENKNKLKDVENSLDDVEDELEDVNDEVDNHKWENFGDAAKKGCKVAAAAVGAVTAAVGAFVKSSINVGMEFDSSMSQVAATMGVTTDEVSELLDFASEMGAKTAFSATQAADALNYMALAGYDANESMEALPNVLNLAAAGGIELATASDMVTDAQSALGLSMEESAELVDKMAKASSKSNTSVAQLGEAILTIGGTAKTLSGGTTELSTALGILADNGIKGAEGGTHLRNMILSLTSPTDAAAGELKALGVNVFDTEGNMRSLNDIFLDLNKSMEDMTDEEKSNAISTLFNKADLASVNALLSNCGDRFDELSGYIDNAAGAAEEMANTQLDNLAGDVTLFQSALEGAQKAVSDSLTPTLRDFTQFGTEAIVKLTEGFKEDGLRGALNAVIPSFDKLCSIMKVVGTIIGIVTTAITAYTVVQTVKIAIDTAEAGSLAGLIAMKLADAAATMAALAPYLLVTAAIAGVIAIIVLCVKHWDEIKEKTVEVAKKIASSVTDMKDKVKEKITDLINSIKEKFIEFKDKALTWGKDLIQNFIDGITAKWQALKNKITDIAQGIKDLLGFSEPKVGPLSNFHTYAPDMMDLFIKGIKDNEKKLKEQIEKTFDFNMNTAFETVTVSDVTGDLKKQMQTELSALTAGLSYTMAPEVNYTPSRSDSGAYEAGHGASGFNITVSIDNFVNNTNSDLDELTDYVLIKAENEIKKRKGVFA